MTKRQTPILPAEAAQPADSLALHRAVSLPPVRLDATLRTPRPLHESDVLFRVELALSRLENGDYGYCIRCDQPIALEALETDPSIVICDSCRAPAT